MRIIFLLILASFFASEAQAQAVYAVPVVDFGSVFVNTVKDTDIALVNKGCALMSILKLKTAIPFVADSASTIPVSCFDSIVFHIEFQPAGPGIDSETLQIQYLDVDSTFTATVELVGFAVVAPLDIPTVNVLNFGDAFVGETKDTSIPIRNLTCDTIDLLNIASNGPFQFVRFSNEILLPDQTGTIILEFDPKAAGSYSKTLILSASEISIPFSDTLIVSGTAIVAPASVADESTGGMNLITYPNPTSASMGISYILAKPSNVSIQLFEVSGKEVASIFEGNENTGTQTHNTELLHLQNGDYFCKLIAISEDGAESVLSRKISVQR